MPNGTKSYHLPVTVLTQHPQQMTWRVYFSSSMAEIPWKDAPDCLVLVISGIWVKPTTKHFNIICNINTYHLNSQIHSNCKPLSKLIYLLQYNHGYKISFVSLCNINIKIKQGMTYQYGILLQYIYGQLPM